MIRRRPFALPYRDQVPLLIGLLGEPPGAPGRPDQRFVEAALAHGLAGRLARVCESGATELSAGERRQLARRLAMRHARMRALRAELPRICAAVADACDALPILIKGPAVADRLYAAPLDREFNDLDLLIPRSRLRRATERLLSEGWIEDVELGEEFAARYGHEVHLRRRRGGLWLHLELHWRIGDDPLCEALSYERLRPLADPSALSPALLVPGGVAELLLLAVHFIGDRERRLVWIDDVKRAAARLDEDDWAACFSLASQSGLSWPLHRALDYADRYAGLRRARPEAMPARPPFGPLVAVEALDMRASVHVGRLAALRGRERRRYARTILLPTRAGLAGTAGRDGAGTARALARHLRSAVAGVLPRP